MSEYLSKHNNSMPIVCKTSAVALSDFDSVTFGGVVFTLTKEVPDEGFYFQFAPDTCELSLCRAGTKDKGVVIDFEKDFEEYKTKKLSSHTDLLARAINLLDHPKVCDLTMGIASDSSKLVYFGGVVTAVERDPVVAALVKNAMERAKHLEMKGAFDFHFGEMRDFVTEDNNVFDAYYLDPMFSHKRSALPKKEMQYLADLVDPANDEDYKPVIEKILKMGRRLVVKRGRQAGPICGLEPKHTLEGKMIRFDVY